MWNVFLKLEIYSICLLKDVFKVREVAMVRPMQMNEIKPISVAHEELIQRLVHFQNTFEYPAEEDLRRIVSYYYKLL